MKPLSVAAAFCVFALIAGCGSKTVQEAPPDAGLSQAMKQTQDMRNGYAAATVVCDKDTYHKSGCPELEGKRGLMRMPGAMAQIRGLKPCPECIKEAQQPSSQP